MLSVWTTSSLKTVLTPTAVALGNFDGIHLGHQQVIRPTLSDPGVIGVNRAAYPTVVTFHPHPQQFFTGQTRRLLTPLLEKEAELARLGIEQLVLLPFDQELADLNPEQFVEQVLIQGLQAKRISVGQDFCFGRQRTGTAHDLKTIAATYGVEVDVVPLKLLDDARVSSSAIRQALHQGNSELAAHLLGRPYRLVGQVVSGQQRGRTIGFPTANLQLPAEKFLPRQGVYAVRVAISQSLSAAPSLLGVMNLGCRPTVDGINETVEVHLLDWSGDLYDQVLVVSLKAFLRPEQKFASLEALKAQIELDCTKARALLAQENP